MAVLDSLFNAVVFERTAVKIIENSFSPIAGIVVKHMFRSSGISVNSLKLSTRLSMNQILRTLAALTQHNLVSFFPASQHQVHYKLIKSNILYFLQKTKYIQYAREKLGAEAELVVEGVLEEGSATSSQIIIATACKLMNNISVSAECPSNRTCTDHHIRARAALMQLVEQGFLKRCPAPQASSSWCPNMQNPSDEDLHRFNNEQLDLQAIAQAVTAAAASGSTGSVSPRASSFPDSKVYWTLHHDTFHLQWRDELLLSCVERSAGPAAREVFGAALRTAYNGVQNKWQSGVYTTAAHVKHTLPHSPHVDRCLTLFAEGESGGCLRRIGVGGAGGEYSVEVAEHVRSITAEFLAKRIKDKFGSKAARVFRLVLKKHIVNADMIASACLLDRKEADQLSNMLFLHQMLLVHDIRKASAPTSQARELLFFKVNFLEVVRVTAAQCFTEIYNMLRKRELLAETNKALMEKKTRVDAIVSNIVKSGATQEQIQDIEEMVTQSERDAVSKWLKQQDQLLSVVTGIMEDLFLLELFMRYYPDMEDLSVGRRAT